LALRGGNGKLAEHPHDHPGPLLGGGGKVNYSGIISRFLPLVADFNHVNPARFFRFHGYVNVLGDIGGNAGNLPGFREVGGKTHLAPKVLSRLAPEPDNVAGLDLGEGLAVALHGQDYLGGAPGR